MGYPLMLSQMSFTLQTCVDRLFLTWYSEEALAGAVTGLFTTYGVLGIFVATGEYLTTFIAQYQGAGRPERIGSAVWQGIYFSALAGLLVALLTPFVGPLFDLAGHAPSLRAHEVTYSRLLLLGAFPVILMATLSSFFAGRGRTGVVLLVNLIATLVNVALDYAWIFGRLGFPRAGVAGAAYATILSQAVGAAIYLSLILAPSHRRAFHTLASWRFEPPLFRRLLRLGLPAGLQYSLEIFAFAVFLMLVGRISTTALAASGIAFNLNMIVFMPMVGLAMGTSALVARHLGEERPDLAERTTHSAFSASFVYMSLCGALYLLAPRLLLQPYAAGADPTTFPAISEMTMVLLRFVALYSLFDAMSLMFAAGLKGAGDTRFPLKVTVAVGIFVLLIPTYVACIRMGGGVYVAWWAATAYVVAVGLSMRARFRHGGWKSLRIIEPQRLDVTAQIAGPAPEAA